MCFGVRDALEIIGAVGTPRDVTIHGELVHNEAVLADLDARGFRRTPEDRRNGPPPTPAVLITAHGVSDAERGRLEAAGKHLIDTTCPLVRRVHKAARELRDEGYHVLVIGRRGHVEVRGVVDDLESFDVIETPQEVRCYDHPRLGVICQTTASARVVAAVRSAIVAANPAAEIRFVDTVCQPTKDHQKSLERLLEQVEAVVVIGGKNSNNTRELVALCHERGVPALHVQDAADLDLAWLSRFETVGLTAGTSTLDETIEEIYRALMGIHEEELIRR
jgi:4-hydroxy-3-methylbut-2-enyl diphosphate reductase